MSDADARSRIAALLDAELLVPTPDPPSVPGACEEVEPEQLLVAMHEDEVGLAFPAFTTPEAYLRWRPEGGVVARRTGRVVVELASADADGRLALDPGSPDGVLVAIADLAGMLFADSVGADPALVGAPTQLLVAASSEPLPPPVAEAIAGALAGVGEVEAAHLVVVDDGTGSPGRCLAVRLVAGADPAVTMPRVVDAIAAATPDAAGLTLIVTTDELRTAIEASGTELHRA